MAKKLGMDVGEMQALQKLVRGEIKQVSDIMTALDKQVRTVDWQGSDANQFRNVAWVDAKKHLNDVSRTLTDTEKKIAKNIHDQQATSSKY